MLLQVKWFNRTIQKVKSQWNATFLINIADNSALLFNVLETANIPNTVGQNSTNQNSFNSLMNEKMAVNAIQKSLMQVESSVKSPSPVNIIFATLL